MKLWFIKLLSCGLLLKGCMTLLIETNSSLDGSAGLCLPDVTAGTGKHHNRWACLPCHSPITAGGLRWALTSWTWDHPTCTESGHTRYVATVWSTIALGKQGSSLPLGPGTKVRWSFSIKVWSCHRKLQIFWSLEFLLCGRFTGCDSCYSCHRFSATVLYFRGSVLQEMGGHH